jgi:hypothetical protein
MNPADADGDGASSCAGDCNDNSAALNLNDVDNDNFSTCEGDCNDNSAALSPADVDGDSWSTCENDCNDNNAALDPEDADGDGWSTCDGDCNDVAAGEYPTATEIPYNGIDDDCVGGDLRDVDGDGYNAEVVGGFDCNDNNPNIKPTGTEICNGLDDDCDSKVDEQNAVGCTSYYYDGDGDGYGTGTSRCQCDPNYTSGYEATNDDDCYDANADAHPGQLSYFYDDRGDGSWDYNCDGSQTKSDKRTTVYSCNWNIVIFPPSATCYYTSGWWGSGAPACGDSAVWGSSCDPSTGTGFCQPDVETTIDQECR